MNKLAILLILVSGLLHSIWNYLAKSSTNKIFFIWLMKLFSLFLLTPLVFYWYCFRESIFLHKLSLGIFIGTVLLSGVVHFFYNYFLAKSYSYGEMSFAYPFARGNAPFLVALFSFLLLGEKLSFLGGTGMFLTAMGVLLVSFKGGKEEGIEPVRKNKINLKTFIFAGLTALMIAIYTFVDGTAARKFGVILFMYSYSFISTILLAVPLAGNIKNLMGGINDKWQRVLIAAALMSSSYLLALFGMKLANLGYVASMRNISIVFATFIGVIKLNESCGKRKIMGSFLLFGGILAITLG